MPGKSVKVALAAVLAAGALAGCGGRTHAGAAALVGDDRITTSALQRTVRDWQRQFAADPDANGFRSNLDTKVLHTDALSGPAPQVALDLLVSFRIADEAARREGVPVPETATAKTIDLYKQGGLSAESVTLAAGLPRDRAHDFARYITTQTAFMVKYGADPTDPSGGPGFQRAAQQWKAAFQNTARKMRIEINPRFGTFDPEKAAGGPVLVNPWLGFVDSSKTLGPVEDRLSAPESGT